MSPAARAVHDLYMHGNPPALIAALEAHAAAVYAAQNDATKIALMRYKSDSRWVRKLIAERRSISRARQTWNAELSRLMEAAGPIGQWTYVCHGYGVPKILPVTDREHRSEMQVGDVINALAGSYLSTALSMPGVGCSVACNFSMDRHIILHLFLPPTVRGFFIGDQVDQLIRADIDNGGARFTGPGLLSPEEAGGMPIGEVELLIDRGYTYEIIGIFPDHPTGKHLDEHDPAPLCGDYRLHIYAKAITH